MKKSLFKVTLAVIFRIYLLSLSLFFIFRLILFFTEVDRLSFTAITVKNILLAFIMGLRFDIVIIGYVIFLPSLALLVQAVINKKSKYLIKSVFYFLLIFFSVGFLIAASDIPYFNHFFKRFDIGAFEWIDSPLFVFKMIIEEPRYIFIVVPFVIIIYLFYRFLKIIFSTFEHVDCTKEKRNIFFKVVVSLFVLTFMFVGIRGRVQKKSPIRVGTAYFCQDPFLNQLGLNPVFTLLRSYLDSLDKRNRSIDLMDNQIAVENVRKYLRIEDESGFSPIVRKWIPDTLNHNKHNIVIIIMESMSAAKMHRFGNSENLTPFLDSLTYQSYFFNNIYTAGEHTFNGIFSTLFSYPALYRQHTMKKINSYMGISYTLKNLGYSTTYFTTHDGQFDNVEGFLHANHFDNVISQSDYPAKEVKTTLGVPDDYMFRFSIPKIDELHKQGKPFFITFMTVSDHGPIYIPGYFKPHSTGKKEQVVEYADWSLRKFISLASKTEWFDNTIFVFIADHGAPIDVNYPISLNYHHSPLLFYAPHILTQPKMFDCIGGQIDVYPTLMGLLKQPYINNTLGVDLINDSRPYIVINGDDKVAALDNEFLFVLKGDDKMLYKYKELDKTNYTSQYPDKSKEMELYLKSNLQTYQYMLNAGLTVQHNN